ncbi:OLC1v1004207C2 [Oldenlandia corymbosa var. corymbosa]|uniref:OLC1v1004207C2 n=1 Tax=Oldenlandia corymbosa var. corymbosa TaxID=529605 RepID=A0AAV1DBP8_OLDCO|nr:OLC1v1004207C2 [Oldenlandia corymbosa var. corymbosa]
MSSSSEMVSEVSDANSAPTDVYAAAAVAASSCESSEEVSSDWFHDIASVVARNLNFVPPRDLDLFQVMFNMSRRTFEYVCSIVREAMIPNPDFSFSDGRPMTLYDQVAVALRRLSSGGSLNHIGASIGVHPYVVSKVTWTFVQAMETKGRVHLSWPRSHQELTTVKSKFEHLYGLPNCCGSVDVTHILLMLSRSEPGVQIWLDHIDNHSMLLMSIVDSDLRFMEILVGFPGILPDSLVLQNSKCFHLCQNGDRLNGEKLDLSENAEMQEYIIGDSGFPLLPWLMTPYQGMNLQQSQAGFNRHLMAAHDVSQKAFLRLKQVWKMIDGVMWKPDKHKLPRYIFVCCILHNIIIDMEDEVLDTLPVSLPHDPGYWTQPSYYADDEAVVSRDILSQYLALTEEDPSSSDASEDN